MTLIHSVYTKDLVLCVDNSRPSIKEKRSGHARLVVIVQYLGLHNVKCAPILGFLF